MLKKPHLLFINCIGSYYYSIFQHLSNSERTELLLFLVDGKLEYKTLDEQEVRTSYHENPWGYQPIWIVNKLQNQLKIDERFYRFLNDTFHIRVDKKNAKIEKDIVNTINENMKNGIYSIVNVDEFYVPTSQKCYGRYHNKHSLMVLEIDSDKGIITLMDSEENHAVEIELKDFKKSVTQSKYENTYLYLINTNKYSPILVDEKLTSEVIIRFCDCQYIDQLLRDMSYKFEDKNALYYFRGYYYNILSKVIPYLCMVQYILSLSTLGKSDLLEELIYEYRKLCDFMRLKIVKHTISYEFMYKKLSDIKLKYSNVINELHLLWGRENG